MWRLLRVAAMRDYKTRASRHSPAPRLPARRPSARRPARGLRSDHQIDEGCSGPARPGCAPAGTSACGANQISAVRSRPSDAPAAASGERSPAVPNGVWITTSSDHVVDPAVDAARQRQRHLDRAADAQQLGSCREQVDQLDELARRVLHPAQRSRRSAVGHQRPRPARTSTPPAPVPEASPACPRRSDCDARPSAVSSPSLRHAARRAIGANVGTDERTSRCT